MTTTAIKTRKSAQPKTVQIIARFEFKTDARKVVYKVRSSDGEGQYETTLFAGRACSCTCKATKPCYHMMQLEAKEQERRESANKEREVKETADSYARMFYYGI